MTYPFLYEPVILFLATICSISLLHYNKDSYGTLNTKQGSKQKQPVDQCPYLFAAPTKTPTCVSRKAFNRVGKFFKQL